MTAIEKRLLYISPTIPAPVGNGRAMRAYYVLKKLCETYQVHLLVISREVVSSNNYRIGKQLSELCTSIECVPIDPLRDWGMLVRVRLFKFSRNIYYRVFSQIENLYCSAKMIRTLESLYQGTRFEVIHVFRAYMIGFSRCFAIANSGQTIQLDLDDIESRTHRRLGDLYKSNRMTKPGRDMHLDAARYQVLEAKLAEEVDRVFVCSNDDKEWMEKKYRCAAIDVLPNVVHIPEIEHPRHAGDIFRFLFVGSFGYFPNFEGMSHFCRNILPRIRERATRPFEVHIVGTGLKEEHNSFFHNIPNMKIIGKVADVSPHYFQADAVIIPLRAGGGTRIKVLEAFAHKCPVVSTAVGVEGIAGQPDQHFLIADKDAAFAESCLRLMNDPPVRQRLATVAHELVQEKYVFDAMRL